MDKDVTALATANRPYSSVLCRLREAGLRPTQQRLGLAKLLFDQADRHVTAEALHSEAQAARLRVSLATVYNTLHQFTEAGLLRQVVIDAGRTYFDTNTGNHHHFYFEDDGSLADICGDGIEVLGLPDVPGGCPVSRVDVIVRVRAALAKA